MKHRSAVFGAALLAALLLGSYSLFNARAGGADVAVLIAPSPSTRAAPAALRRAARAEAVRAGAAARDAAEAHARNRDGEAPELPGSLRGTGVDGALLVGPDGKLLIGPDVIRFFDYFLSATGEESDAIIRARIEAAIRERLQDPAALEAIALLDKYMAYREAARTTWGVEGAPGIEGDPAARLASVRALRREHFDEETASLLFGDEEIEGAVAVEQSRILKDPSLTPEEREAQLREAEARLPEAAREARAEAIWPLQQRAEEAALREAGATDDQLRRHRVAAVGEDGADRLEALDQKRAEWKRRVETFRIERDKLASRFTDEGARQAALQKLLEDSFTPEERLRVKAILSAPKE